jgi:hypothetical protein
MRVKGEAGAAFRQQEQMIREIETSGSYMWLRVPQLA